MRWFLFLSAFCFPLICNAGIPSGAVEARYSYGFVMRHHMDMGIYTQTHFPAYEISMFTPVSGSKKWHHDHCFPEQGISFWHSELGNSPVLGNVSAIIPWIRLPLFSGNRAGWYIRIGTGLGYFEKKFDPEKNYKNLAIGSHFNACINLGTEFRTRINKHFHLFTGLGWTHFSNGTMVAPNYGINMPNINAGLSYMISDSKYQRSICKDSTSYRASGLCIGLSFGVKQILPLEGPYYNVLSTSLSYVSPVKKNGTLILSFDLFNDQSDKSLLERKGVDAGGGLDLLKSGISAGMATQFGRTSISFILGTYLTGKEKSDGAVYDKLGIDVALNPRMAALIYLKTHYAKADYIGWGIKYNLIKR